MQPPDTPRPSIPREGPRANNDPGPRWPHTVHARGPHHPPGEGATRRQVRGALTSPARNEREAKLQTSEDDTGSSESTRPYARKPGAAGGRRARQDYMCEHCSRAFRANPVHDHRGICPRRFCSKRRAGAHRTAAANAPTTCRSRIATLGTEHCRDEHERLKGPSTPPTSKGSAKSPTATAVENARIRSLLADQGQLRPGHVRGWRSA